MRLTRDHLQRAESETASLIAIALCAGVEEAAGRLGAPGDEEAIHDLRVALRRLRSALRAFEEPLGRAVTPRHLRRLRKLARASGPAREAEVLLAWLRKIRPRLRTAERGPIDWLLDRVERRSLEAARVVASEVAPRVRDLAARLSGRIAEVAAERPGPQAIRFGPALAVLLLAQASSLRDALAAVGGPGDVKQLHRARIEGKRLRYLLEPLREVRGIDASEAVERLKGLQDVLGEWNDLHTAVTAVARAVVEAEASAIRLGGSERGRVALRTGLLDLAARAERQALARYRTLELEWLRNGAGRILGDVYAIAAALDPAATEGASGNMARGSRR
jgi:CHAD domain-containing protein